MGEKNKKEEGGGFTVKDRRMFDSEGNLRDEAEKKDEERRSEALPKGERKVEADIDDKCPRELPPIDFNTFISSLATAALMSLGEVTFSDGKKPEVDLLIARQHIDIIDMLIEKTKGNLKEDEERYSKRIASDLKWLYLKHCSEEEKSGK
ncbi:MAG: hypothetical protein Kow0090_07430 [Myxococcota bacterium]